MPPQEKLLQDWERYLEQSDGLNLGAEGVTTSMVYWADVFYPKAGGTSNSFESAREAEDEATLEEDLDWIDQLPEDEQAYMADLQEKLFSDPRVALDESEDPVTSAEGDKELEKFTDWIPGSVKRFALRLLKPTHYYFLNKKAPLEGADYFVRDHIRGLFINQLMDDAKQNQDGAHIVVSHSMGTVISYDCFKNVEQCPQVDAYITLGSPLGYSEMHEKFTPRLRSEEAFPSEKLKGSWVNIFDEGDLVVAGAPLKQKFLNNGKEIIVEEEVRNPGYIRHGADLYLAQSTLRQRLAELLDL
jgi:hypothetical protein